MLAEQYPHLPAFALHENEALARSQGAQIRQFEFDFAVLIWFLEEEDSLRFFPATHGIIILQMGILVT
jgi:hypothetical protein